jgi:hypothetical protein
VAKKQKEEPIVQPGEFADDAIWRALSEKMQFKDENTPEKIELERARELCRKGNPFHLIALQWPELVITDPVEIELFNRAMTEERFAHVTESIRSACLDPANPHLRLDWWQKVILAGFFAKDIGEQYIKGCTGAGKGGSTAIGFCLWYDVYTQCRISLTGANHDHAVKNIFGETKSWYMKMKHRDTKGTAVLKESIEESERRYIKLLNPDPASPTAGESFSGAHGPNTLAAFDENSAHPEVFERNARKNARKIICLANPRIRSGSFYRAFEAMGLDRMDVTGCCPGKRGKRLCVTIGGLDCINVSENRLAIPVAPPGGFEVAGKKFEEFDLIDEEYVEQCKPLIPGQMDVSQFIAALNDSTLPECFAHGRFPKEDAERQIILPSWLPRHEQAWNDSVPVTCVGLDVALSLDGDNTVIAVGSDKGCRSFHPFQMENPNEIAREVIRRLAEDYSIDLTLRQTPVCIDYGGGYGRSVGPVLMEMGVWVIPFEPGGSSSTPRQYANMRAEGYGELAIRLDPNGPIQEPWGIPILDGLREELCAPEREYAPDMIRWKVKPKVEIKQQLGRSPDFADALTYLFHAVKVRHNLQAFLHNISKRSVVLYPTTKEEAVVRKIELEKAPTEWDKVQWDWAPKQINDEPKKNIVTPPDKNPRKPWYTRYLQD